MTDKYSCGGFFMNNGNSTFSPLDCVENLKKAGFNPEQATAFTREIERSRADMLAIVATKEDIAKIEKETVALRTQLEGLGTKIDDVRNETANQTLKIIGVLGGLIAVLKFLPDFFN